MWKELKNFIIKIIEELLSDIKTEKKPTFNRELMIFIQKRCFIYLQMYPNRTKVQRRNQSLAAFKYVSLWGSILHFLKIL